MDLELTDTTPVMFQNCESSWSSLRSVLQEPRERVVNDADSNSILCIKSFHQFPLHNAHGKGVQRCYYLFKQQNDLSLCHVVMLNQANVVFTNGILIGNAIFCAFKSLHLFNIGI